VPAERLEAQGIKSAGQLFKNLKDSGLSGQIASELYSHEKAHADADFESQGEFGYVISSGWVVAYYIIQGERNPKQLMEIASAPGFSNMSSKDWEVYNRAWRDWLNYLKEEEFKKIEQKDTLRETLVDKLGQKLEGLESGGRFPALQKLLGYEFKDLILEYGELLYQAYEEAISEVENEIVDSDTTGANAK